MPGTFHLAVGPPEDPADTAAATPSIAGNSLDRIPNCAPATEINGDGAAGHVRQYG